MNKHDKKEIKKLLKLKEKILSQREELKDLSYEEKISRHLKNWRG